MPRDVSASSFCEEKKRLIDSFVSAVREMNSLQDQQIEAMTKGDPDLGRFDLLLHAASEKKNQAKYDWIAHVEEHGCGKPW
jgi:hypothetical protein